MFRTLLAYMSFCLLQSFPVEPLDKAIKVVGCGSCGVDYLASVAAFPHPDQKLRTDALEVSTVEHSHIFLRVHLASVAVNSRISTMQSSSVGHRANYAFHGASPPVSCWLKRGAIMQLE
jgi:hypothetical protein